MSDHHASVSVSISAHLPGAIPGQPLSEPKLDKEHKEKNPHADGHENDGGIEKEKKKLHPDIVAIKGYEDVSFLTQLLNPAAPPTAAGAAAAAAQKFDLTVDISKDEAKHALQKMASEYRGFVRECADEMKIKKITNTDALRYTLETFTQLRGIQWVLEPYNDQPVDGPDNGPAPSPWEVDCHIDPASKMGLRLVEVPHTAVVTSCFLCKGKGEFKKCPNCKGDGDKTCDHCSGTGRLSVLTTVGSTYTGSCPYCGGDGKIKCITCRGQGKGNCITCNEKRKVKQFIRMVVVWGYQMDEFVHEKSDMPDSLVKLVKGEVVFDQELPQVHPVTSYPLDELNKNSALLIEKHRNNSADRRIMRQRHQLRVVPVAEIEYHWKDLKERYWIFGKERRVYAPNYPQKCVCILL